MSISAANPLADCADFPALDQLARALWRTEGPRGAAVFVGAGLSRDAVLSSADLPPPPLWSDLAAIMRRELYPADADAAPWDPLRLAEEYRTYFGQAALDAFIREHVRDIAWQPAPSHARLLDLPWSDVLTTNYDTLLERGGRSADRAYDTVRSEPEIAFAKAPRIIKLHGSIGATDHFVIAEEDFRTYPARHAAFVNLARQCFVENELCLLGFSGDDPNFLAWAGWVRDHLGSAARRIFLAGALDLSPAKRKYLEARNVAPVDVYPLVAHLRPAERYAAATRLILDALHALKPEPAHAWTPGRDHTGTSDDDEAAQLAALEATIERWKADRLGYPGWLICPRDRRTGLRFGTETLRLKQLEALAPARAASAMFEWCWRHQAALWPIHPEYAKLVLRFADPVSSPHLGITERLLVAHSLLEHAREADNSDLFTSMAGWVETNSEEASDARASLRHQQALLALRDMDYPSVASLSDEVVGQDPVWQLRRAGLLVALGRLTDADTLTSAALADLRERERADRASIWVRSRVAWAMFLHCSHRRARGQRQSWPERFRESRCDPWQEIEAVIDAVAVARRKQEGKPDRPMPNFQPGSFRLPSQTIHFGDTRVEPSDEFTLLFERAAVPVRIDHMTMFVSERIEALELRHEPTLGWYLSLLGSELSKSDPQFERYFGRVAIATLSVDVVMGLVARLKSARDYWRTQLTIGETRQRVHARDRLILLFELLARLAIRLDDDRAIALHLETIALWSLPEVQNVRFAESISRLLASSFEAVSPAGQAVMLLADLDLPLLGDDHAPDPVNWVGSARLYQPKRNPGIRAAVARYLQAAVGEASQRKPALSRLTYFHFIEALTPAEARRFARVAWAKLDAGEPPLPADSDIFDHYWARLAVPGRDAAAIVQSRIFGAGGTLGQERHAAMIRAARSGNVRPNPSQARDRFDEIAALRFEPVDASDVGSLFGARMRGYDPLQEAHFAGAALTWALAPNLESKDRTLERLSALELFGAETGSLAATGALVPFLEHHERARTLLETAIRRGLMAQDSHRAAYAADALRVWLEGCPGSALGVPVQLIDQLVSVVELRQSSALWRLLDVVTWLVRHGRLAPDHLTRIEVALGDLSAETHYSQVDPISERAGTVSLVREYAVRLASALRCAGRGSDVIGAWLELVGTDALPEVRHALAISEE